MESEHAIQSRLSKIETHWTKLILSQTSTSPEAREAQRYILHRYSNPIFHYFRKGTGNADAADELFQEFATRFVEGKFKNASPELGQFRKFLKTALCHLLSDYYRKRKREAANLSPNVPEPADDHDATREADAEFVRLCQAEILERAWSALEAEPDKSTTPLHVVLRAQTDNPAMTSTQLAEVVGQRLGREVSAELFRNRLHYARAHFADLLLMEIERTLTSPTLDELAEEAADLGLLEHCRAALERRRGVG